MKRTLNATIFLVLLTVVVTFAMRTPPADEAAIDAATAAATAAFVPSVTAAPTTDTQPWYMPSEFTDAERNAPESGEAAPTF